ncbi:alpha-hydroxy-acid oxidizing enzyme [Rhodococcoides fascians]|nr:pre-mycofactocin synthase MftD [Rhodococcus sp. 06-1059B-a]OZE81430.1 alpha-hydroxy-acid oxidizing enzyme [Rhodococcus fascians]OZD69016.1 alpha-hydroxy-acid oxidizing enzyme [Rhodococcus sp. 06-1059B-a]OZF10254.1 alpha-hydroxy-acid oxidizing enzyme [Rhodococcus fascians]OZF13344.1 alpha-hydroxy-acid oxidizing enzyme [Rhodococcus fascians]OZF59442.1 alpha-hydroxy-acid oxidizing enzyme [Rhodococcus fascians]
MTRVFETVSISRELARKTLPRSVDLAVLGGQDAGVTMDWNEDVYRRIGLRSRVVDLPAECDQSTEVLQQRLSTPVILSPAGAHGVHPAAEPAVARAAAARGTLFGLSSFATKGIEEVADGNASTLSQIYWIGSRDDIEWRVEKARAAGAVGLVLTTDWCFSEGRDWGSPKVPRTSSLMATARFAPEVIRRPRWLLRHLGARALPDFIVPNLATPSIQQPTLTDAWTAWRATPPPTWDDVRWLAELWGGPLVLKGVMRPDDARRAVDAGVTAVSVSNHGGFNLDTTIASVSALPGVVAAVGADIEVLVDGGIRRGSDVVKAIALGARAVFIGRPYLWGLAVNGQAGVENTLDIFISGIASTMRGLGYRSLDEITLDDMVVPTDIRESMESRDARPRPPVLGHIP